MTLEELDSIILDEGDDFSFTYGNIECTGTRHPDYGHWCGYVKIPSNFGYKIDENEIFVHGGITWNADDEDGGMMIGFDANHSSDLSRLSLQYDTFNGIYRDIDFIKSECRSMVDQIHEIYPYYIRGKKLDELK